MKRFRKSVVYACEGIVHALHTQRHMRFHIWAAAVAIVLGAIAGLSAAAWALLLLTIAAVMAAELLNTAVERVVDMVSPDFHPLAKAAKDAAAGAVLVLAVAAAAIGLVLLGPPLWQICFG